MSKFLTFHVEPDRRWEDLVERYRVLARETTATWVRTYLFEDESQRICEWDAPSPETLHVIFARTGITCDRIVPVREVLPQTWR
ncbi:MAG: nickel-binding protein [Thermodesulfobacteriota bacterium]|jgi:hypothetical protein